MIILCIILGLVILLAIAALLISQRPSDFSVTRSASISAPPEAVFAQVNNLYKWQAWSPWAKLDPAAKNTFEGPPEGAGASFAWSGNMNIGAGKMTIVESQPASLVRFRLDFEKPMKGTNMAEFTFKPQGRQTFVTWTMTGKYSFMGKVFGMLMNCDKMVGGQFEQGLSGIKAIAEGPAKA